MQNPLALQIMQEINPDDNPSLWTDAMVIKAMEKYNVRRTGDILFLCRRLNGLNLTDMSEIFSIASRLVKMIREYDNPIKSESITVTNSTGSISTTNSINQ